MSLKNYQSDPTCVDYTPSVATTAGTAIQLADGTAGIVNNTLAANELGAAQIAGVAKVSAASATTWSDGDEIWYDASAANAVKKSNDMDGDTDFRLGIAVGAKVSGTTVGYVRLNQMRPPLDPIVYEFDVADGDVLEHVLIPAEMNPNGLVILQAFGIVTEVMAGSSEDQGIVTVEDEDDNVLSVITAADAAADASGDILIGTNGAWGISSGSAIKTVAAGKAVQGFVSQQTSGGTPAGKIKVYIQAVPLV